MIEYKNFSKRYGSLLAVDNLNLTINDGEIFGLIGHNGAGKSTTIKSTVGSLPVENGEILVNGLNVMTDSFEVKKLIGYVADSPDLFLKLPAYIYWQLIARAFGLNDDELDERLKELLPIFELETKTTSTIGSFSHGMRQKVFVIGALLSKPSVWILDEPLTGLDPKAAYNLKELMKAHAKDGNSVVFSTHVLQTAEQLCNRIGILYKGKLIFVGTIEELKKQYNITDNNDLERIYLEIISKEEDNERSEE